MNFTGGHTLPRLGRRINWQLVTLAGGLAVAISAGVLAGAFERDGSPATTAVTGSAPAASGIQPAARSMEPPAQVYVIVDSPARAEALQSALSTDAAAHPGLQEVAYSTHVVTIQTPEQQAQFDHALAIASAELSTVGMAVNVVDLRATGAPAEAPTYPTVYIVGSDAEQERLERRLTESGAKYFSVFVLQPGSPEDDALYNTIVGEQMASGAFDLIDLR